MKRGIVIGKFYPPHKGHLFLIKKAKRNVDQLTVIICHDQSYSIPAKKRAEWLKQSIPEVDYKIFNFSAQQLPATDSQKWAEATKKLLGYAPDVVFSSESYGQPYAFLLGSKHVLVDLKRKRFPISGAQIRKDPYRCWLFLEDNVKKHYLKKVCLLGAESTGTTTLAQALAKKFKTVWVPEYGRTYWEGKLHAPGSSEWKTTEFIHIAKIQNAMEDALLPLANKILICDTNSWVTSVWHERYLGKRSKAVEKLSRGRNCNLYLVTKDDFPFVQDGTRDGKHIRHQMHLRFVELLKKKKWPYKVLAGNRKKRLNQATLEIKHLLKPLK